MRHLIAIASFAVGFGALLAWKKRAGAATSLPALGPAQRSSVATTSSPLAPEVRIASPPAKVPTVEDSPSASTEGYLTHLSNAAGNLGVVQAGAETQAESDAVNQAWAALSIPIDTLTAQKDLNVLGAKPTLVEDGVMGPKTRDAILSFQGVMEIPESGVMDSQTSNALRRAVVAVTSRGPSSS